MTDIKIGKKAVKEFKDMLDKNNFILFHGTNVKYAESIMKTGLNVGRTTAMPIKPTQNPLIFASYAWKESEPSEAVNVVIQIPMKEIWGNILTGYDVDSWIDRLRESNQEEYFMRTLLEKEEKQEQMSIFDDMSRTLPNHFIRGYVKLKDRNSYYMEPEDVSVKNIEFIENEEYFGNLGLVKQQEIINYYHDKYEKMMTISNAK